MTLGKLQPFCLKKGLDIGVYKLKTEKRLPRAVKNQKVVCIYTITFFVYYGN